MNTKRKVEKKKFKEEDDWDEDVEYDDINGGDKDWEDYQNLDEDWEDYQDLKEDFF